MNALERIQKLLRRLAEAVIQVEWSAADGCQCPFCGASNGGPGDDHRKACVVEAARHYLNTGKV